VFAFLSKARQTPHCYLPCVCARYLASVDGGALSMLQRAPIPADED
jgi:hypothetical protein